ncbi:hypothetical protein SAMD00019534_022020 [Acytostelium subglobosum LB1]|uniref:hypothetical protein n=1 Tax=Acytostelium subglobosum LB1 TaxID=1410327 RepID=UPI000644E33C|nr:hypothetical protein SAMD00019534_022020 [Acytostelium subglobosum LB1]GAM19027.1 hypothetical protein SAMD00019534_022020 [Acytostelium subglobosum LB1]|eukprot:XP_012756954.1 hypothetical protein SAMD00019534_022020 [Acytostelium subglobosum LB1]
MFKVIIFAILFVSFTLAQPQFPGCTNGNSAQTCLKIGANCSTTGDNVFVTCERGSWCAPLDPVDNKFPGEGTCTRFVDLGGYCNNAANKACYPGFTCYGNEGAPSTCQWESFATLGQSCQSKVSCQSSNQLCLDGTCQLKPDTNCSSNIDCPFNQYCMPDPNGKSGDALCVPALGNGGNCSTNSNACGVGFICSPTTTDNTDFACVAINSKGAGQACGGISRGFSLIDGVPEVECDVSQSLVCLRDNTMKLVCQSVASMPSGAQNCSSPSTSCPAYSNCACSTINSDMGECSTYNTLGASCSDSINQLIKCAIDNKCQTVGTDAKPSCLYQHCNNIICNNPCAAKSLYDAQSCGSYPAYSVCRTTASSSSSFIRPSMIVALVAVLVAAALF